MCEHIQNKIKKNGLLEKKNCSTMNRKQEEKKKLFRKKIKNIYNAQIEMNRKQEEKKFVSKEKKKIKNYL